MVTKTNAQVNLVSNPSFESYTACPNGASQLNYAANWYAPTVGSPDFFDTCFTFSQPWSSEVDVPSNFLGYQHAFANGGAYSGVFAFYVNGGQTYREYIQSKLTTTLIANQKYFASFFISLADSSVFATDDFGLFVSTNPISLPNWGALGSIPQISNPQGQFLNNKTTWTKISGFFIAGGGEEYITIGNFKADSNTDTLRLLPNKSNPDYRSAYYYIDQICLSSDSLYCNNAVGLNDIEKNTCVKVIYFNQTDHKIIIHKSGQYILSVFDAYGALELRLNLENYQEIDACNLAKGCHFIHIKSQDGIYQKKIIIFN